MGNPPEIYQIGEPGLLKHWQDSGIAQMSLQPTYLIIANQVAINLKDGSVTFHEGYNPDVATRQFWEALSEDYRQMLRWKVEHPDAQ